MEPGTDMAGRRTAFEEDAVGSEITAVQNDRVHPQGARYQGPILNLFQLEMTAAKQLYPDAFGAWPRYESGPYPEIPTDEQLFDRERASRTSSTGTRRCAPASGRSRPPTATSRLLRWSDRFGCADKTQRPATGSGAAGTESVPDRSDYDGSRVPTSMAIDSDDSRLARGSTDER